MILARNEILGREEGGRGNQMVLSIYTYYCLKFTFPVLSPREEKMKTPGEKIETQL